MSRSRCFCPQPQSLDVPPPGDLFPGRGRLLSSSCACALNFTAGSAARICFLLSFLDKASLFSSNSSSLCRPDILARNTRIVKGMFKQMMNNCFRWESRGKVNCQSFLLGRAGAPCAGSSWVRKTLEMGISSIFGSRHSLSVVLLRAGQESEEEYKDPRVLSRCAICLSRSLICWCLAMFIDLNQSRHSCRSRML